MARTRTVGVLVDDDVEVLDVCAPFEVFAVGARISTAPTPFRVVLVADRGTGPLTSAGISAGIDLSLHLVGHLAGRELAVRTARRMDDDRAPVGA